MNRQDLLEMAEKLIDMAERVDEMDHDEAAKKAREFEEYRKSPQYKKDVAKQKEKDDFMKKEYEREKVGGPRPGHSKAEKEATAAAIAKFKADKAKKEKMNERTEVDSAKEEKYKRQARKREEYTSRSDVKDNKSAKAAYYKMTPAERRAQKEEARSSANQDAIAEFKAKRAKEEAEKANKTVKESVEDILQASRDEMDRITARYGFQD